MASPASYANKPTAADLRVILYDPDRAPVAIVEDYISAKARPMFFGQGTAELVIPVGEGAYQSVAATATHGGSTALAQDWLNWSLDVYWRGVRIFTGPVGAVTYESFGYAGTGVATLHAISWELWLLGGKTIQTSNGGQFVRTSTEWDTIARELVEDNATSSYTAPTEYPAGEARDDFGPFSITVSVPAGSATVAARWSVQNGKPLWDSLLDLCLTPESEADHMEPYLTEGAAGVFAFNVRLGRNTSGGAIGSDLTGSVRLSGYHGHIARTKLTTDHQLLAGVWGVQGTGRGGGQRRSFIKDSSVIGKVGTREDVVRVGHAVNATDRENEARRLIWEGKLDQQQTWDFELIEQDGLAYGVDFNVHDTITAVDAVTGRSISKMIAGAEVSLVSPGPPTVKLIFGRPPRSMSKEQGRSGGGGRGGGRSGGGPPKDNDGQSEVDPDEIVAWVEISGDQGSTLVADVVNDTMSIIGSTVNTPANIVTDGADDPEVLGIALQLACASPTTPTLACYAEVLVDGAAGSRYVPIIEDGGAGASLIQNLYRQIEADSGSPNPATASSSTDKLRILGGSGISTTISQTGATTTVTVAATGGGSNAYTNIGGDSGSATAASSTDSLDFLGGTAISTTVADGTPDSVTIAFSGVTWGTITADSGSVVPGSYNAGLSVVGGTAISTSGSGSTVTVAFSGVTWGTITGDAGSDGPSAYNNALSIVGDGCHVTTNMASDTLTISWCLTESFCAGAGADSGRFAVICVNDDCATYAVKLYRCATGWF